MIKDDIRFARLKKWFSINVWFILLAIILLIRC